MIKIFIESDKFSHKAGVTKHATNTLARKSQLIIWLSYHISDLLSEYTVQSSPVPVTPSPCVGPVRRNYMAGDSHRPHQWRLNYNGLRDRQHCPVGFLVVSRASSVLLHAVVMSYVDCGNDG